MSPRPKKTTQKKQLGKRGKVVFAVVCLALVAALGYFVLVRPKKSEAAELDAKLADLQTQIVARTSASTTKPVDLKAGELFRLAKAMPDRADMAGVILELNKVAADSGIVFQSIVPGPSTPKDGYQLMPVNVVFEGDFYSLSDFLYRLRNLVRLDDGTLSATGRLFTVDSLSFAEAEEKFPRLLATLTVNAFVYGTATPASSAPTETTTTATTTTTTTTPATGETPAPPAAPTAAPQAGGTS